MAGIYVHVPFCGSKCAYCDFYSIANQNFIPRFADAIAKEWNARRKELGAEPVTTLYFGGGTPSLLTGRGLAEIAVLFPKEHIAEMTIEVNPEHVNTDSAEAWRKMGFNRVSMGVQSLVDDELTKVGRRHSTDEALLAISILRKAGFNNISADLIYGLPGQTLQSWQYSMDTLLAAGIEHLSAYCLSYEAGTRLFRMREQGRVREADEDAICTMYDTLCKTAHVAGFEHYEISNFAKPGFRSRHNSSYWQGTPYLGLGPGAHSLGADGQRRYVKSDIKSYITDPLSCLIVDPETELDSINDNIMTALRTADGLNLQPLAIQYRSHVCRAASKWIERGILMPNGDRLTIAEQHWLMADAVIRDLLCE